ncbi:MAG: hydroxymethylglutaryl-CoA lyase, partial [Hyphomicrobiaceae bacterium]
ELVEVGPRDGVQNIPQYVPTETKVALIKALIAAGFKRMEIGSFVSPKAIPQMRDMEDVVKQLGPIPGIRGMVLVPNAKGAERALAAGIKDIEFVISMSDAHNMSNVRRPTKASIEDLKTTLTEIDPGKQLKIRIGLATSFHCPFAATMDETAVLATIESIVALRDGFELALSDTTGMALPHHVKSLSAKAIKTFGKHATFTFHGHDTAGFGIANVLAAMDASIRSFDGSVGGLGGCPFAPGATGNISSEDMVYLFARMGVETGIDLDKLFLAGDIAVKLPGAVTGGHARNIPRDRLFDKGAAYEARKA